MMLSFFSLDKKRFPFLGLLLAAIAGILVEDFFSFPSCWLVGFAIPLGIIILSPLLSRWRGRFLFVFVAACFGILHAWQWSESPGAQLASLINDSEKNISVEGMIRSEPKVSKNGSASFFLALHKVTLGAQSSQLPVMVRVHWEGGAVAYGDDVSFQARASLPQAPHNPGEFDALRWLTREGVFSELIVDPSDPGKILSRNHGWFLLRWAFAARHWAERTLSLGVEQAAEVVALIQGITLGTTTHHHADALLNDFRLTGTMHLFAVSGLHVGMIAVILWFVFKFLRLPRRVAVVFSIAGLFFYVMMTGFHIGSWRAAIMASILLSGFLVDRRPQMLNSLAAAGFCLLAVETNLLFSPGWQFSFSVVAAIVILVHPFQKLLQPCCEADPFIPKKLLSPWKVRWYRLSRHGVELISVSLAAWIGALIPSIFYFHRLSFSGLGANVIAVPLAFCILSIAVMTLFFGLFSCWMAAVFNNANFIFAKLLLLVVHGWTLLPWSSVVVGGMMNLNPALTLFDIPGSQVSFFEDQSARWLINTGTAASTTKVIIPFLETKGITRLNGLLLTGEKAIYLGGAALLLPSLFVDAILMPGSESRSCSFHQFQVLNKLLEKKHQVVVRVCDREHFSFSSDSFLEIFSPPAVRQKGGEVIVFKIATTQESFLFLPTLSQEVKEWLLQHKTNEQLHATVLVLPSTPMPLSPEDAFLKAVAPHYVVIGGDPRHQITPNSAWKELFKQYGMTLLYQEETGALLFKMLPEGLEVVPFLKKEKLLDEPEYRLDKVKFLNSFSGMGTEKEGNS
ncbi:MAG: ComEC/Rec2 family competence protein [Chthoniobacterales bacterium]|nr:ComEC/Rec2 family competence protein [Chthoniobacterales bacterium]